ncbi:S8 family serine peptidase [Fictibacillus sp. B-59209]|uniref:S8 family peptidase n=1 Tax=Fictibacillus sp. B-59209 TaxID=3024873 RepID=UPI002E23CC83|nr:S8 family serine peptidase [Fictibacillus sp. B-59209]
MKNKLKKTLATVLLAVLLLLLFSISAEAYDQEMLDRKLSSFSKENRTSAFLSAADNETTGIHDRQIIVKLKNRQFAAVLAKSYRIKNTSANLQKENIYTIELPHTANYQAALDRIRNSPLVEAAEPNFTFTAFSKPNDKLYARQWSLPRMGVPRAWDDLKAAKKHSKVTVAVLDSGVNYRHPDLKGQTLKGYDTYEKDADPMDRLGHGTKVSGVIAAKSNNLTGVAGINPYAKILPIRIGNTTGATLFDFLDGLKYAISQKPDIINISMGSTNYSQFVYEMILTAYSKGILVIAASGNEHMKVSYPAAYPEVLAFGSTNEKDRVSDFSNYGPRLDLTAPGENIWTTNRTGSFESVNGTSFSAPAVSGVASLLLSKHPDYSPCQIEYLLEKNATRLPAYKDYWNIVAGYGRARADRGLSDKLPKIIADAGNSRGKAKSIKLGKTYSDSYHMPMDSDWFKFSSTKKMTVKAELSGVSGMDGTVWMDHTIKGEPADARRTNDRGLNGTESFTYTVLPGTSYLQIYEENNHWSTQSYKLTITQVK